MPPPNDRDEVLTAIETANLLRFSPRTLEGMRRDGRGPRYMRLGAGARGKVIYCLSDINEWLMAHVVDPKIDEDPTKADPNEETT